MRAPLVRAFSAQAAAAASQQLAHICICPVGGGVLQRGTFWYVFYASSPAPIILDCSPRQQEGGG